MNGNQGHFELPGGRVGFLLLHGLGGTPVELRYVGQGLNRAGFSVLCPQMAGHGGSDLLLATSTWMEWLDSAEQAFDKLRQSCEHVIVGGLSAGAIVSLHLAAKRQSEIAGLTLFSPTFWPNGWAMPWYSKLFTLIRTKTAASLLYSRVRSPFGIKDDRIRRFVLEALVSEGRGFDDVFGRRGGTVWEFRSMAVAAKRLLAQIEKPTLICHARQDDQSDLSNAFVLQRRLGGPVDVVVLDDCYHMITLDRQRTQVVDKTIAFAESLGLADRRDQAGAVANLVAEPRSA